jgi:hypothetical protein
VDIAQGRQVEAGDWDAMRRERRQLTRAEWAAITSSRPVARRILSGRPEKSRSPGPSFLERSSLDTHKRVRGG